MIILKKMIVSNSDITKNYKTCRDRAESCGKVFILKNNEPDAVLFPIAEYERLSGIIEYAEHLDANEIADMIDLISKVRASKDLATGLLKKETDRAQAVEITPN